MVGLNVENGDARAMSSRAYSSSPEPQDCCGSAVRCTAAALMTAVEGGFYGAVGGIVSGLTVKGGDALVRYASEDYANARDAIDLVAAVCGGAVMGAIIGPFLLPARPGDGQEN